MREIYTKAWAPIMWLGEQVEGSDEAMNSIKTLATIYSPPDGVARLTSDLHKDAEKFGKGTLRALNEFVCRRYWRRLWILQEAARGRSTSPVLCGNRTLSWGQLPRAFQTLIQSDEVINTYITNELKDAELEFRIEIWPSLETVGEIQSLQDSVQTGKQIPMYRLLNLSRTVFSTDPRDKIYELLGVMPQTVADLIRPSYEDTVLNVYRSFVLTTIEATGSLDIIRHTIPTPDSSLPSWVPDWRVEQITCPLTLSETTFTASGATIASAQPLADVALLSCKGLIFDTFDGFGVAWGQGWSPDSITQTEGDTNPYGSFHAARIAIWNCYVAAHRVPNEPLTADYGCLLASPALADAKDLEEGPLKDVTSSNIFEWCVKSLGNNASFRIAGRPLEDYFWDAHGREKLEVDAVHLRDALMQKDRVGLRRRLATTKLGYVGLVLETVERSDVLAVLYGCSMPMVLRKVGMEDEVPRYKVVGECYVHGIMDGEAMGRKSEVQGIVLC